MTTSDDAEDGLNDTAEEDDFEGGESFRGKGDEEGHEGEEKGREGHVNHALCFLVALVGGRIGGGGGSNGGRGVGGGGGGGGGGAVLVLKQGAGLLCGRHCEE